MIHIAICDDEPDFIEHLTALLNKYALESGEEIKISTYRDGLALLEKYARLSICCSWTSA